MILNNIKHPHRRPYISPEIWVEEMEEENLMAESPTGTDTGMEPGDNETDIPEDPTDPFRAKYWNFDEDFDD